MIPILYEQEETAFTSNGIGRLSDAIECVVSEQINDYYTLSLTYPSDGQYANEIKTGRLILATPSDGELPQPFRIYEVNKLLGGTYEVQANHISYDLSGYVLRRFISTTAAEAIGYLTSMELIASGFTFSTDLSVSARLDTGSPRSYRAGMGGSDDSILGVYGGEWYFDRYSCQLLEHRGDDNGVSIRYGKNLTDLSALTSDEEVYTGVFAYWQTSNDYVSSQTQYIDQLAVPQRILITDHSSDYQTKPTTADLNAAAQADFAKIIGVTNSLTVSFVPLWQTEEYKYLQPLEHVKMGDIVTVIYDKYDIATKLEVVKTDYNVLLDRYETIELGAIRPTLADTIANLK